MNGLQSGNTGLHPQLPYKICSEICGQHQSPINAQLEERACDRTPILN